MEGPLVVFAAHSPVVGETIESALAAYYQQSQTPRSVTVVQEPCEYKLGDDGLEGLVREAFERAESARVKHGALIGLAGAWGRVTVRMNKSTILQWDTFVVIACSDAGLIGSGIPEDLFPSAIDEQLDAAMEVAVERVAADSAEPEQDVAEIAGAAIVGWTNLQFNAKEVTELWVQ